jgi:hypothetical protein
MALTVFGLPGAAEERVRWMGAYHARFTDLPVPVCEDLVRLWDRPPLSQSRRARAWLSLAHASCCLRRDDRPHAALHLAEARALQASAPADAQAELLLVEAYLEGSESPERAARLAAVGPLLERVDDVEARACLHVRWVDQRAYAINRGRDGHPPRLDEAEALYRSVETSSAPPFVLSRRANGLAYARWKQGYPTEAAELAREAARHAGDGGHVRLRAMALAMLARVAEGPEAREAHRRAAEIAARLEDETLRFRFDRIRPKG